MIDLLLQAESVTQIETPDDVDWGLLGPLVTLSLGGVLLVTITSVVPAFKNNWFPAAFTIATAGLAGYFTVEAWRQVEAGAGQAIVASALMVDTTTSYVTGIICGSVALVAALLHGYLKKERFAGPEWYVLILMSAAGGILLSSAEDLIVTFIGLEILSIAVYVLASLHLRRSESQEAGFKYFLLGALSSALFLYGIALAYGATGSTSLRQTSIVALNERGLSPGSESSMILVAMALIMAGFAFKVAAVPFHVWTPDVYEGSPSPVVAFMASVVKVAGFAGLLRVFLVGFEPYVDDWRPIIQALAIASLVVGSLLAIVQTNVKRMLAYSSITHAGFILVGVYAAARLDVPEDAAIGSRAVLFYFLAYSVMVIGTFGVVTLAGRQDDGLHSLSDYNGLFKTKPIVASAMVVLLFAQAGVPFTSGFLAKFRVIVAAVAVESYLLAAVAVLASAVAAVLYLRVVVAIFLTEPNQVEGEEDNDSGQESASSPAGLVVVGLAALATIALGLVPFAEGVIADAATAMIDLG